MVVQIGEIIPVKGVITQFLDAAVIFSPFAAKRLPGFPALLGGVMRISCAEYIPEVFCHHSFITMTNLGEHITLEVCHTLLERSSREDFSQRIFKTLYAVGNQQTNTLDASMLQ